MRSMRSVIFDPAIKKQNIVVLVCCFLMQALQPCLSGPANAADLSTAPASSGADDLAVQPENNKQPKLKHIEKTEKKRVSAAQKQQARMPDSDEEEGKPEEVVHILEEEFAVPKPWAGHRVRVPQDTVANLMVIPPVLTLEGVEIALRKEALAALEHMAAAAKADGVELLVDSAYRSAAYQHDIYVRKMEEGHSFERIARSTAPPGYSGHALGTAVDFHPSASGFQKTRAYRWLQQHASRYGFHETYSKNNVLGVVWEPWHWEYQLKEEDKKSKGLVVAQRQKKEASADQVDMHANNDPDTETKSNKTMVEPEPAHENEPGWQDPAQL